MAGNTKSPLERICRVLSSKNKNVEENDNQGDAERLSNPVTSALQYRYQCDKCDQSFSSKGSCWNHKKRVHPTDDDLTKHWNTCEHCGKSFFYKKQYDMHMKNCAGAMPEEAVLRCPMCSFTCLEKLDLADHVMNHDHEQEIVEVTPDDGALEPHVLEEAMYTRDNNGQYYGDVATSSPTMFADDGMPDEADVEIKQSEKGTWQCPMCPIRCTEKEDVKIHMKDRHLNKVRKHACSICKRAFTHSSGLKQHITRVHGVPGPPPDPDGAKYFKCGLCGKAFSLVRSLISHWPTHKLQTSSSLENFQCILCNAFFQLPSQLQDHFIKQHPQEATMGSVPATPTSSSEKRGIQEVSSELGPPVKMEKLDDAASDEDRDSSRGVPGLLSNQEIVDADEQPSAATRKMRATTSASSPTNRINHSFQTQNNARDADADDRPPSHISSMTGSEPSKEATVDGGNDDAEPTSSQSCVSCMEKSGRLLSSCKHCGIYFTDFVMHTLHMGLHGQEHPFQCHHCGKNCGDKYNFFTHVYRESHM
ncbi:uncharacterized protein [Diadema antillarum]|uniref:uncharacterized protein n=1 Tax=Diadema antillarum TaxID=105358 RepID=UPI003A87AC9C